MRYIVLFLFLGFTLLYSYYEKKQIDQLSDSSIRESGTFLESFPSEMNLSRFDGSPINMKDIFKEDKKILFHFWATWCVPCEKEFPPLLRLSSQLEDYDFYYIAINDEIPKIKKFIKRFGGRLDTSRILIDNSGQHQSLFGVKKIPETFVFGSKSQVIRRFAGPQEWDRDYYFEYLESL